MKGRDVMAEGAVLMPINLLYRSSSKHELTEWGRTFLEKTNMVGNWDASEEAPMSESFWSLPHRPHCPEARQSIVD